MPLTDEQFQQYVEEQESAKEALGQTISEQLQVCVQLRTQNAMLRRQIARLSPPAPQTSSEPTIPTGSETNPPANGESTDDSTGDTTASEQARKVKKAK